MLMSNENLYHLCNKNQWFTQGTNRQYDKLFYANSNGCSIDELATIIWLCSDTEKTCRRDIKAILEEESKAFIPKPYFEEDSNAW